MKLAAARGTSVASAVAGGGALDELMNLLTQLGLGTRALPIYDMIMDLETDSMTPLQLEQAIRSILTLHGCEACADAVVAALAEVNYPERRRNRSCGQ